MSKHPHPRPGGRDVLFNILYWTAVVLTGAFWGILAHAILRG